MSCLSEEEWRPENHYAMYKISEFRSKKWKITNSNYEIKVQPLPTEDWQTKMIQILDSVLSKARAKAKPGSMGRLVIFIDGIRHTINDRVVKIEDFNVQQILDKIAAVLNSNEEADLSKGYRLNIIFAELPTGGGARAVGGPGTYHKRTDLNDEDYERRRRPILNPARGSKDKMCMAPLSSCWNGHG